MAIQTRIPDVPAAFAPLFEEIAADRVAEAAEEQARHARMADASRREARDLFAQTFAPLDVYPHYTLVATCKVPLIATHWRADCGPFAFELVERHDAYYLILVAERELVWHTAHGVSAGSINDGFRSCAVHDRTSLKGALEQWQEWVSRTEDDDLFGDEPQGY